jgi:diaminopimelate decarboxylase
MNLNYKGQNLFVDNTSIKNIAKNNITPFYVYSYKKIRNNFETFSNYFKRVDPLICFSVKSNSNISLISELGKLGSGADVVSEGELLKALKAKIKPNKIVFSGVGKTESELKLAVKKRLLLINIESESEARLIDRISRKMNRVTPVGIRINPGVDANTHSKISTGRVDSKFGLPKSNFLRFCRNARKFKNLKIKAISVHIGSQITSVGPYRKTLNILYKIIRSGKINFEYVDLGGGFGIPYQNKEKKINIGNYSRLVKKFQKKLNCKIIFEPGRFITGNAGALISKILFIKQNGKKYFIIIDAGMNDFMRPALYNAMHNIIPVSKSKKRISGNVEFVGPICESTDTFLKYKNFAFLNENDLVAITNVGAYGSALSSNYNTKPLASEIIVKNGKIKIARRRQKISEII